MNSKDKEAFTRWLQDMRSNNELPNGYELRAWQAACEYKQKEIDEIHDNWAKSLNILILDTQKTTQIHCLKSENLEAENKKLREALREICGYATDIHNNYESELNYVQDYADKILKEVESK